MNNKSREFIRKYLIQASNAEDVISNHAFGRVARKHKPIPKRRSLPTDPKQNTIARYRDSMVGSASQYHDRTIIRKEKPGTKKDATQELDIIGNRPRSEAKNNKTAEERRHHFIEPPKRNFNQFD